MEPGAIDTAIDTYGSKYLILAVIGFYLPLA
jgi:hypothetical protein